MKNRKCGTNPKRVEKTQYVFSAGEHGGPVASDEQGGVQVLGQEVRSGEIESRRVCILYSIGVALICCVELFDFLVNQPSCVLFFKVGRWTEPGSEMI